MWCCSRPCCSCSCFVSGVVADSGSTLVAHMSTPRYQPPSRDSAWSIVVIGFTIVAVQTVQVSVRPPSSSTAPQHPKRTIALPLLAGGCRCSVDHPLLWHCHGAAHQSSSGPILLLQLAASQWRCKLVVLDGIQHAASAASVVLWLSLCCLLLLLLLRCYCQLPLVLHTATGQQQGTRKGE